MGAGAGACGANTYAAPKPEFISGTPPRASAVHDIEMLTAKCRIGL